MRDRYVCPYNKRPRVSRTYTLGNTLVDEHGHAVHCGMNARQMFAHTTQEQGYADAFLLRTVV